MVTTFRWPPRCRDRRGGRPAFETLTYRELQAIPALVREVLRPPCALRSTQRRKTNRNENPARGGPMHSAHSTLALESTWPAHLAKPPELEPACPTLVTRAC